VLTIAEVQQVVAAAVAAAEKRLVDHIERLWDGLIGSGERVETEYAVIKGALARIEERLTRLEERLDSDARTRPGTG
jgi:hypothetical protein